jgi:predicted dehydrogenase
MKKSTPVKIAVVGAGGMGRHHCADIAQLDNVELVAVCDSDHGRADDCAQQYQVPAFYEHAAMLDEANLDAVLIATPHYDHPRISIDAFERGLHVLTEKPIAVHVQDARKMITAYERAKQSYPELTFGAMFQQRTYGYWLKIKALLDQGELGRLVRATWIITDWFRTQSYYDNGGWRATWQGEGGGVLLNQCPHNLDLYQWFVGMPRRVAGFAALGQYHNIEVEDQVTGYFEYENEMVGHFSTSTAESPGTNRLEIVGENGKLVFEKDKLTFFRNRYSMFEQIENSPNAFEHVENWVIDVPYKHHGQPGHRLVIENFADAILHGKELVAPAVQGINSLELGNAMLLSSFLGRPLELPLDAQAYADKLQELIASSRFQKVVRQQEITDLDDSF